jgi:hypothetical protein
MQTFLQLFVFWVRFWAFWAQEDHQSEHKKATSYVGLLFLLRLKRRLRPERDLQ